jgi:hypothetical protein
LPLFDGVGRVIQESMLTQSLSASFTFTSIRWTLHGRRRVS